MASRDWLTISYRWLRLTGTFEDRYFGSDIIAGDVNQGPSVIAAAISRLWGSSRRGEGSYAFSFLLQGPRSLGEVDARCSGCHSLHYELVKLW